MPGVFPSATTTIALFFPIVNPARIRSLIRATETCSSGMASSSAPPAMPLSSARNPAVRPITSMKKSRSWDRAVSRMRSIASTAQFAAVSNPMQ